MTALYPVLGIPMLGMVLQALFGHHPEAGRLNVWLNWLGFAASLWLALEIYDNGPMLTPSGEFRVDAFNVYLVVLTAFVGSTTSMFSAPYMENERRHGRVTGKRMRLYHAMYQGFMLAMFLVLTTNNLGFLWVSMEGATLATVLLVSLYRTPESIEAAWKYFILCGVGIAQALFGTVLLYFAAMQIPDGHGNLQWSILYEHAADLNPTVTGLAFVFLLVGYGTKIGLAPLRNWLPDAHSEGPTPMSAILSGLLLNDALYAVVRCKMLVDGSTDSPMADDAASAAKLVVMACFEQRGRYLVFRAPLAAGRFKLPSQTPWYPGANRPERHTHDAYGIVFQNHPDSRRWLRHQAWRPDHFPLRKSFPMAGYPQPETPPDNRYEFQVAESHGVYEIPVGPIHAGIIYPDEEPPGCAFTPTHILAFSSCLI